MMRSESTSALGHPRLTNPTFGWRRLMRGRYGTHRLAIFQPKSTKRTKGWAHGAALVLATHLLWFGLIYTESRVDVVMPAIIVMFSVVMNIAGLGAFITSLRAPRHGLALAVSLAPLSALLATLFNMLLGASGTHVDFSGFHGSPGLFAVTLAYGIFVSLVGGGI